MKISALKIGFLLFIMAFTVTCKHQQKAKKQPDSALKTELVEAPEIYGNYVSDGYNNRAEGYDWVSVTVAKKGDEKATVKVRSRADKKRPTCTLDVTLFKQDKDRYTGTVDGKIIVFTFHNDSLTIAPENPEDENVLYFYCSGGATVAGTYQRINEPLNADQIDPTIYSKVLRLQGIGFNVSSTRKNGVTTLTVQPFGLQIVNDAITMDVYGYITNAEIEDLNSDGSPDLFIYSQSEGSGSYGNVYAFSVNNLKSMSQVYFPETAANAKINQGYMGHDEFAVVENRLVQRFPIYNADDTNASPSGKIRQISYKLVEGEAMRKLEIDSITEY